MNSQEEELLQNAGIDIEEALVRFSGNREIYEELLKEFLADANLNQLQIALLEKDYQELFHRSHALKGISANLSLNALYKQLSQFVDLLRRQEFDSIESEYDEVIAVYHNTSSALERYFAMRNQ